MISVYLLLDYYCKSEKLLFPKLCITFASKHN